MTTPVHLIYSPGTRIVTRNPVNPIASQPQSTSNNATAPIPAGAVAEIIHSPHDAQHAYKIRFNDGTEAMVRRSEFSILKQFQDVPFGRNAADVDSFSSGEIGTNYPMTADAVRKAGMRASQSSSSNPTDFDDWKLFIIYRCVIGSQAYGLSDETSDTDIRGIYQPPAELHWSLYGVPEQIKPTDSADTAETYWELQKFLVLALKANPNILECLYTPLVQHATPLAQELLAGRKAFMSKIVYQTFNGYVLGQFKKLEQDLRARGEVKWKHAMHLIRLLLTGITALREGELRIRLDEHRDALLEIKRGERPWPEVNTWRLQLHKQFEEAFASTALPERPDYEWANAFLVKARRADCQKDFHSD